MAKFSVFRLFPAALLALTLAPPSWAQGELTVEAGKPWTHAHSGITVPATLGGNALTKAKAYAQDELDVSLNFEAESGRDYLAFYIFRNTNGGVPVWMAQAQWSIENSEAFQGSNLAVATEAFTPPGQATASGLKAVYAIPHGNPYKSTGVALLPVGAWYVKLRATSRDKSPEELSQAIGRWLTEIHWPTSAVSMPTALAVLPCSQKLAFDGTSKDAPVYTVQDAVDEIRVSAAAGERKKSPAPAQWCRDNQLESNRAVYRADNAKNDYLLAVGDNGNGVSVAPSIGSLPGGDKKKVVRFGITLHTASQDVHFVSQDRLPSPARILEIINAKHVTGVVPTWNEKREIPDSSGAKPQ